MIKLRAPGDGPTWLPDLVRSIEQAIRKTAAPTLIADFTGNGTSGTLTIPIEGGYNSLRITCVARSDTAATATNLMLQLNGDAGLNYDTQFIVGNDVTASASNQLAAATIFYGVATGSTAPADEHGVTIGEIMLPGSSIRKHGQSKTSYKTADAAAGLVCRSQSFWWRSTAAITSLTMSLAAGNFTSSTVIRVEGVI